MKLIQKLNLFLATGILLNNAPLVRAEDGGSSSGGTGGDGCVAEYRYISNALKTYLKLKDFGTLLSNAQKDQLDATISKVNVSVSPTPITLRYKGETNFLQARSFPSKLKTELDQSRFCSAPMSIQKVALVFHEHLVLLAIEKEQDYHVSSVLFESTQLYQSIFMPIFQKRKSANYGSEVVYIQDPLLINNAAIKRKAQEESIRRAFFDCVSDGYFPCKMLESKDFKETSTFFTSFKGEKFLGEALTKNLIRGKSAVKSEYTNDKNSEHYPYANSSAWINPFFPIVWITAPIWIITVDKMPHYSVFLPISKTDIGDTELRAKLKEGALKQAETKCFESGYAKCSPLGWKIDAIALDNMTQSKAEELWVEATALYLGEE